METQQAEETKKCPKCKEDIKIEATLCKHCGTPIASPKKEKAGIGCLILLGVLVAYLVVINSGKDKKVEPAKVTKEPTQEIVKPLESNVIEEANPVKRIEAIVKKVDSELSVTVWDSKKDFAKETTPAPYEVTVVAGKGLIASCYYAKIISHDVMQGLYSDAVVKNKISRVVFSSWGNLRVSVSAEDGVKTDWIAVGPTNFWTTMMKYKPYEDETGPIDQRTWGVSISNDCN